MQEMLQSDGKNFTLTAPDPYTVVINTGKPHAGLLDALCPGNLPIIPKHTLHESYKNGTFAAAYNVSTPPDKLVTSGAWRLGQHVTNEKTVLVRNPYYFGFDQNKQRLPYLDELVILIVPDQDAADLKFRAGGIDAVDDVKPENYRWYEENQQKGNFTLYDVGASQATHLMSFNLNKCNPPFAARSRRTVNASESRLPIRSNTEWFNNRDFRRAISMAIDRDALIKGAYYGYGEKNWSQIDELEQGVALARFRQARLQPVRSEEAARRNRVQGHATATAFLEDARGNQVSFIAEDEQQQCAARQHGKLHPRRRPRRRHRPCRGRTSCPRSGW